MDPAATTWPVSRRSSSWGSSTRRGSASAAGRAAVCRPGGSSVTRRTGGIDFLGGTSPWTKEGRAAFIAESPITYAANIRTQLLILSDTGDQRVPIAQSYALYHAVHDRGGTVTFIAFPRAGHFPTDPVGRESVERQWSVWFDRWMK